MRTIQRNAPPDCLARQSINQPWSEFMGSECHNALDVTLRMEQQGLCCYCEHPVADSDGHIEHLEPRQRNQARTYDYTNLALSCNGGNAKHCGHYHPYSRESGNAADLAARAILENRGNAPRLYRNTLVFLAADKTRLQDLDEAARKYLAWLSILDEQKNLNLSPYQVTQAENQKSSAESAVTARLPETWQWLLVPVQSSPQAPITWEALRLTGSDPLAVRASKKLRTDELFLTSFAPTRLRMELDRIPLWRGDHVAVKQLVEDFARYLYLPRLKNSAVLLGAISAGLSLLTWSKESFGFADSFDETAGRYRGLRNGTVTHLTDLQSSELVVKPDIASRQIDAERAEVPVPAPLPENGESGNGKGGTVQQGNGYPLEAQPMVATKPKRFHGTATLDATRVGRDASKIAEEVIAHLAGIVGARVNVTIEIEAELPDGAPDNVVRTVTENSRTLKFTSLGFEKE